MKQKILQKILNYINTTLLLSQGKSWIEKKKLKNLKSFFM